MQYASMCGSMPKLTLQRTIGGAVNDRPMRTQATQR